MEPFWFNLQTYIDTNLDHQLENVYRLADNIAHFLCIYSSAWKFGFISYILHCTLYTVHCTRSIKIVYLVKFQFFRSALPAACEGV